ncbi:MAG: GTPase HflX, partial [Rhizobiales bacterium]|nr:GTPase HflX [Hyphomicrobiales bacterium]
RGEGDGRKLLEVWNKIDRLEPEAASDLKKRADGSENAIVVSALKGEGIDALLAEIERLISGTLEKRTIRIAPDEMSLLPWVYERSHVLSRQDEEDGAVTLDVEITAVESAELDAKLGTVVADDPEDY